MRIGKPWHRVSVGRLEPIDGKRFWITRGYYDGPFISFGLWFFVVAVQY